MATSPRKSSKKATAKGSKTTSLDQKLAVFLQSARDYQDALEELPVNQRLVVSGDLHNKMVHITLVHHIRCSSCGDIHIDTQCPKCGTPSKAAE